MFKSDREGIAFSRFRELYDGFPPGKIDDSGESPDFIVHCDKKTIGIEHTDLYWKHDKTTQPFQAAESIRRRVVEKLREMLETSILPPVWVSLYLGDHVKYHKTRILPLAKELFYLVIQNIPQLNSFTRLDADSGWEELPEEAHWLEVRRLEGLDFFEVTAPETFWVPVLQKSDIERVIARKEKKLTEYRSRADEIWLLITLDSGSMATQFTERDSKIYSAFETNFDRVFVLWVARGIVKELEIDYAASKSTTD